MTDQEERAALERRIADASGMTDDELLALGRDLVAWRERHPADAEIQGEELALLLSPAARARLA